MTAPEYSFGTWVKRRRKALDLTQDELARRVGCSLSLIFKIESDERRPSRQIAKLLAEQLEIPTAQQELFLKVARQEKTTERLEAVSPLSAAQPVLSPRPLQARLPIPLTSIIGRAHELSAIIRQIQDPACRLLTLIGPGGVGKTRLALEVANHVREVFEYGTCFVSLVGISTAEFIIPTIAETVGFVFSGPVDLKTQLFDFLKEKEALLILDNLEHLLDGIEILDELLESAPLVKLLTTSREQLNLRAEWVFEVQGLPIPSNAESKTVELNSAATLFLERARQVKMSFTPVPEDMQPITRICQLVDGLPLGLELAAAWVRNLSCREIAQEIENNMDFLAATARDLPQRHRSMRAVFDSSWNLLSEEERHVMMRLSVFRGGFSREAAEQVAGAKLPLLSSLIDKSLVRRNKDRRYDMHELTRQYAQLQLIRSGSFEDARNQHLKFYLAFVEETNLKLFGAEQILWLDRLEEDLDNLRAALEWSLRLEEAETKLSGEQIAQTAQEALRLASLLHIFWKRRSHWTEGREWLRRALAQSAGLPVMRERINALNAAALLAVEQADTRSASEFAQENLTLSQEVRDLYNIARAFNTLGMVRWKQKYYAEGRTLCEQGLALFRGLGDRFAVADSLHSLGHITINQGDLEAARSYLDESLLISQELENKIGFVEALGDLGLLAYLRCDYATAQSYLEDSLKLFREANLLPGFVSALNRLGDLARCQGDYEKADRLYTEGLTLYREMGDLDEIPSMLHNMGYIALHRGNYSEALGLFKEGLSIQQKMGNHAGIAECLMGIAGVLSAQGQAEAGARLLGAAEALRERVGASLWPANRIEHDRILARLKSSLDEPALAAAWAEGRAMSTGQAIAEADK